MDISPFSEVSYCIYALVIVYSPDLLILKCSEEEREKKKPFFFLLQGGGIKITDRRFGQPVYPSSPRTNHIALLPENFLVAGTAQPISRRDFLSVLASVTSVKVRASYSTEPSAVYR